MSFKRKIRRAIKSNRAPKLNEKVAHRVDELLAKKKHQAPKIPLALLKQTAQMLEQT